MRLSVLLSMVALAACGGVVEDPKPHTTNRGTTPEVNPSGTDGDSSQSESAPTPEDATRTDLGWAKSAQGCGDFNVVVTHASKHELLVIQSSRAKSDLKKVGDSMSGELGGAFSPWDVHIELFDGTAYDSHCTALGGERPVESLYADSGTISVRLTRFNDEHDFDVSVLLENVSLHGGSDGDVHDAMIASLELADVHVGTTEQ